MSGLRPYSWLGRKSVVLDKGNSLTVGCCVIVIRLYYIADFWNLLQVCCVDAKCSMDCIADL